MGDVRQWLDSLGLGQYADVFEKNAIEAQQVAALTDEELRELGIMAPGNYQRGVDLLRRGEIFIEGRSDTPGLPLISTRLFLTWCLAELGEFDEAVRIAEDN